MTVRIVPATPAEIPALAALLARAFARDPTDRRRVRRDGARPTRRRRPRDR